TSLMKSLYVEQEGTGGEYIVQDDDTVDGNVFNVSSQKKRRIRNEQLGMVYQNPIQGLKMDFSSVTNIAEKLIASGNRNVGQMTKRADHFLEKVNIALSRKYEAPKNFSGGMQQRVQIAKALSNYPPILRSEEHTSEIGRASCRERG